MKVGQIDTYDRVLHIGMKSNGSILFIC